MRIGMMADAYKPYISGVTNAIALNKRYLESLGHEVFVFTFGGRQETDEIEHIYRAPGLPLTPTGFYLGINYSRPMRKLLYTMDVVHVHHPFISGSLAVTLCKPRRIPIVCTNHTRYDLYARAYLPYFPPDLADAMLKAYLPPFYRACDLVIAPSDGMRQVMLAQGVDAPIEVIPNGVDLSPFRNVAEPFDRRLWGFSSEDVLLVFVGRAAKEKNVAFLLEAFAMAAARVPNIALLIIGGGPALDSLIAWVQEHDLAGRVCFTGFVPYTRVPGFLAAADAFVTASVTEVHPLTLIEAMASGLPLLGIDSPGVSDTIQHGVNGLLSSNDLNTFVGRMLQLVTDHSQRREMASHAQSQAGLYAIERTAQIVLNHYERLAAGRFDQNAA